MAESEALLIENLQDFLSILIDVTLRKQRAEKRYRRDNAHRKLLLHLTFVNAVQFSERAERIHQEWRIDNLCQRFSRMTINETDDDDIKIDPVEPSCASNVPDRRRSLETKRDGEKIAQPMMSPLSGQKSNRQQTQYEIQSKGAHLKRATRPHTYEVRNSVLIEPVYNA